MTEKYSIVYICIFSFFFSDLKQFIIIFHGSVNWQWAQLGALPWVPTVRLHLIFTVGWVLNLVIDWNTHMWLEPLKHGRKVHRVSILKGNTSKRPKQQGSLQTSHGNPECNFCLTVQASVWGQTRFIRDFTSCGGLARSHCKRVCEMRSIIVSISEKFNMPQGLFSCCDG